MRLLYNSLLCCTQLKMQDVALMRNALRPAAQRVPSEVVVRAARQLDEPQPSRRAWESATLVVGAGGAASGRNPVDG